VSWGIIFEGPIRRRIRERIGDFLGVPGSQHPIRDFLRKLLPGR